MRREFQVRFWEGPGVQFPRATRLVIVFAHERDAERVKEVLPKRFGRFGLTIHPDKTRLVPFRRPPRPPCGLGKARGAGTFDLLGFTHYWGVSRQGRWVIKRKTAADRLSRSIRKIDQWCRKNRHRPIREQHKALCQKMRGHYAYFGITCNYPWLARFRYAVRRVWYKWLGRRNSRPYPWSRYARLLEHYPLPRPRVVHSVYNT